MRPIKGSIPTHGLRHVLHLKSYRRLIPSHGSADGSGHGCRNLCRSIDQVRESCDIDVVVHHARLCLPCFWPLPRAWMDPCGPRRQNRCRMRLAPRPERRCRNAGSSKLLRFSEVGSAVRRDEATGWPFSVGCGALLRTAKTASAFKTSSHNDRIRRACPYPSSPASLPLLSPKRGTCMPAWSSMDR
jgi:hypothetical protein